MTVNEAIKELQKAKRAQAKLILQRKKNPTALDKKEALKKAGEIYILRRTGRNTVEYIGFCAEPISVAHEYYSSRGIVLNIDTEY